MYLISANFGDEAGMQAAEMESNRTHLLLVPAMYILYIDGKEMKLVVSLSILRTIVLAA